MDRMRAGVRELERIFQSASSKMEAHRQSRGLLEQLSREPAFLTEVLQNYVRTPGALEKRNYPVVGVDIALNPHFGLVANCWIPLPNSDTNMSTKAIHHHGDMLLTTATLFGPGYEHWMFSTPTVIDPARELYRMELLEAAPHPKHHVSFVDAQIAHCPLYPASLSITLALWSSRFPATWKDRVKRLPMLKGREEILRRAAVKLGLKRHLDLKVVEYFDFYPVDGGFKGMRVRKEFELGPNEDHIHSVFHVLQASGNEQLAVTVRERLGTIASPTARRTVERLVTDLERGTPVPGRLSTRHYDVPHANFTRQAIELALNASKAGKEQHGGQFTPAPSH